MHWLIAMFSPPFAGIAWPVAIDASATVDDDNF
jgi:hypothetical protein